MVFVQPARARASSSFARNAKNYHYFKQNFKIALSAIFWVIFVLFSLDRSRLRYGLMTSWLMITCIYLVSSHYIFKLITSPQHWWRIILIFWDETFTLQRYHSIGTAASYWRHCTLVAETNTFECVRNSFEICFEFVCFEVGDSSETKNIFRRYWKYILHSNVDQERQNQGKWMNNGFFFNVQEKVRDNKERKIAK